MKRFVTVVLAAVIAATFLPLPGHAVALGTAFTYQGSIDRAGVPPTDSCTFAFKLYDDALAGTQLGPTITTAVTLLQNGQFSVQLDFGVGIFDGNARWLDISVHCPGDAGATALTPRQAITATPYALYALSAPGGGGGFVLPYSGPVTTTTQDGFKIQNNATTGSFFAIHGVAATTAPNVGGVMGEATGTSGQVIGTYGKAVSSPNGIGVIGEGNVNGGFFEAHNLTGDGSAVYGLAHTTANNAAGVKGVNNSATGGTVGTWGVATASPSGTGVAGNGGGTGGYFSTGSTNGAGDFAGVYGVANVHPGVKGVSATGFGVRGEGWVAGVAGVAKPGSGGIGVFATGNGAGPGVWAASTSGAGVLSSSTSGIGVDGSSSSADGVSGSSNTGSGVEGVSTSGAGVFGHSGSSIGVSGSSPTYWGVLGVSGSEAGVRGISGSNAGIYGSSTSLSGFGVFGTNTLGDGIWGQSNAVGKSGVVGLTYNVSGVGVWAQNNAGGVALYANGLAQVKTLQILGADLAESFPLEGGGAEPGTVLAIADGGEGALRVCDRAYCRRVAGVVSGAHGLPAGVVLQGREFDSTGKAAVAMSGRVWVKCDAANGAIHVGDLLTTAARAGHAMKSEDPSRATGAILGKAMTSLETGTGLVLVLVSLQ